MRAACFHACRASHHLGARIRMDGDIGHILQWTGGVAGQRNGQCSALLRQTERAEDIGGTACGRDAHHAVTRPEVISVQIGTPLLLVILGPLHGIAQSMIPAGNNADDQIVGDTVGGRAFRCVENTDPAGSAASDVKETASFLHPADDRIDGG